MTYIYLRVLGKPELIVKDSRIERLRTWRLWGVLAYVALSESPVSRSVLARAFWPEVDDPRSNLKVALRDLRLRTGQDIFEERNECLSLVPGSGCDVLELRHYRQQASQTSDPERKRGYLEAAALLVRDEFLTGCGGDWILERRGELFLDCWKLFDELLTLKREQVAQSDCVATARELLRYDPENPVARELVLRYDRADQLKEQVTARRLIRSRLRCWEEPNRVALYGLSVFPAAFHAGQAGDITGLTLEALNAAVAAGLLAVCPQGFLLPAAVRQDFWQRLTGAERQRFQKRFAGWVIDDVLGRSDIATRCSFLPRIWEAGTGEGLRAYLQQERETVREALAICARDREQERALLFLCVIWESAVELRPELSRYYGLLERGVPESFDLYLKYYVHTVCARMSIRDRQIESCFYEYLRRYSARAGGTLQEVLECLETALIFFHYKGVDARFDETLKERSRLLQEFPEEAISPTTHHIIAENFLARQRYDQALGHNESFLTHWQGQGSEDSLGTAYLQRGAIFKGLDRHAEARACWNGAIEHFERSDNRHGVASCLEALASLHRESGALSEAQLLVHQAILLFEQVGDLAAVHAAEGTLGDILRDRGQWDKARPLYQKGLEYWRAHNHYRWTVRFEQRLHRLSAP